MQKIYKPIVFLICSVPFLILLYQFFFGKLGPEPVKHITHVTGEWTLRFIILTLLMSPLVKITKSTFWIKYRRMLGLFTFFYATLHLFTYVGIDYRFNFDPIIDDVIKKKYIFIGFAAWLLLVPLAITSSQRMIRILKQNWKKLHKLVYLIAIFGALHFIWLSKTIFFEPLIYSIIIVVLLGLRIKFKKSNSEVR